MVRQGAFARERQLVSQTSTGEYLRPTRIGSRSVLLAAMVMASLCSCTKTHERVVDQRLRDRFGIAGDAGGASLDSAVKVAVTRRVPLGSPEGAIYAYLESNGFQGASRSVGSTSRDYYFPRQNSMRVEATLGDYRAHWYSPIDVCDKPVTVTFEFGIDLRLSNISIVRHGYCI
jgi:hypothetical protein